MIQSRIAPGANLRSERCNINMANQAVSTLYNSEKLSVPLCGAQGKSPGLSLAKGTYKILQGP